MASAADLAGVVLHKEPRPPATVHEFPTVIEGGRNKCANAVLAEFAKETADMAGELGLVAGFAVLMWNDEGEVQTVVHCGERNPFSPVLIPGIASDLFKGDVIHE